MMTHKNQCYWSRKTGGGFRAFWRPADGGTASWSKQRFPTRREANEAARKSIDSGIDNRGCKKRCRNCGASLGYEYLPEDCVFCGAEDAVDLDWPTGQEEEYIPEGCHIREDIDGTEIIVKNAAPILSNGGSDLSAPEASKSTK